MYGHEATCSVLSAGMKEHVMHMSALRCQGLMSVAEIMLPWTALAAGGTGRSIFSHLAGPAIAQCQS